MTTLNRDFSMLTGQGSAAESSCALTYPAQVTDLSRSTASGYARYSFSRDFRQHGRLPRNWQITPGSRSRLYSAIGLVLRNADQIGSRPRRGSIYGRYNFGNGIVRVSSNRHKPWITGQDDRFIVTLISYNVVLTDFYLSARMGTKW